MRQISCELFLHYSVLLVFLDHLSPNNSLKLSHRSPLRVRYEASFVTSKFIQCCVPAIMMLNGIPDSKVHGANMGPIWGRQDLGGPHVPCYLVRHHDIPCVHCVLRVLLWQLQNTKGKQHKISGLCTKAVSKCLAHQIKRHAISDVFPPIWYHCNVVVQAQSLQITGFLHQIS